MDSALSYFQCLHFQFAFSGEIKRIIIIKYSQLQPGMLFWKVFSNSYTCIYMYLATLLTCCRSLRFMFMVRCDFKSWFFINIYLNNMLCSITKLQYTINDTEMKANRQLRVKPLYLKFLWDFLIKTIITNCLPPQLQ